MPILRIKNGPHKGLEVELAGESLIIGRDEVAGGLQILDQGVSRRHAEIFRIGEMHFIRDLGSRNGTFVNEEKITEELLRVGDEVKIGSTICMFEDRRPSGRQMRRPVEQPEVDQIAATTTIRLDLAAEDDARILEPVSEAHESRDLQVLYRVAKTIAAERDIKGLAKKVVRLAATAVNAPYGYMFIKHPDRGELTLAGSFEKEGRGKGEQPLVSRAIIKRVLKFHRGVLTSDASTDDRFKDRGSVVMKGIRSVICAPLVAMDQICGVLYLSTKVSESFTTEDLELATTVGIQAGMAVQGITLSLAQEKNYLELVGAMVRAIEMRDPLSRGHSERVATYSSGIAQAMGLSRSRNRRIQLAALMHNIGVLFLSPDEAARVPGDTALDIKRIDLACQLLDRIQGMSFLVPAIRHHRERWDGSGYPDQLKGEDIPLEARIISVANDFDLMLSQASEQGQDLSTKDAVEQLMASNRDSYDPKVLDALMQAHQEGWLYKPQERVKVR